MWLQVKHLQAIALKILAVKCHLLHQEILKTTTNLL